MQESYSSEWLTELQDCYREPAQLVRCCSGPAPPSDLPLPTKTSRLGATLSLHRQSVLAQLRERERERERDRHWQTPIRQQDHEEAQI